MVLKQDSIIELLQELDMILQELSHMYGKAIKKGYLSLPSLPKKSWIGCLYRTENE